MSEPWIIGDSIRLWVSIADLNGSAVNPASLRLRIKPPVAAEYSLTVAELIKDADGAYHHDLRLGDHGRWYYRWEAGDPSMAVGEGEIAVDPSRFVRRSTP